MFKTMKSSVLLFYQTLTNTKYFLEWGPNLITGETISGQPLFLSQNASTWTAEQTDDLKFNMKVASFDTSVASSIVFENKDIDTVELQDSPVETFSGQTYVKNFTTTHGMYDTNSNVTISGVTGEKQNGVVKIGTLTKCLECKCYC